MRNTLEAVKAFRDAAVADGWSIEPAYSGESTDSAAKLKRDGFIMQILTRDAGAEVHLWGPDGLAINPPAVYSFDEITKGLLQCGFCKNFVDKIHRVGFAGRSCIHCLAAAQKELEFPGWTR
jgi:hypothetical protein